MIKEGDKGLDMLRQLIKEVKEEINSKKIISESKTANSKKENLKEYVTKNVIKYISESE